MNKENMEYLFGNYPLFFKHRDDMKVSLMGFGFECGDGWLRLIDKLCGDITQYYIDNNNDKDAVVIPECFYVVQVKEKYGSLRFYVSCASDKVFDLIHKAEGDSYYICEECGRRGKRFYRDMLPWVRTLCDKCLDVHVERRCHRKREKDEDYISEWQNEKGVPYVEN